MVGITDHNFSHTLALGPECVKTCLCTVGVGYRLTISVEIGAGLMNDSLRTTVICHDPGDDSGDLIVDLSLDVLLRMNISLANHWILKWSMKLLCSRLSAMQIANPEQFLSPNGRLTAFAGV